jgi:hypothetical protein
MARARIGYPHLVDHVIAVAALLLQLPVPHVRLFHVFSSIMSVWPMLLFSYNLCWICCSEILIANNAVMDWLTLAIVVWNFGSVGMVCVHWKGPLLAQQVSLGPRADAPVGVRLNSFSCTFCGVGCWVLCCGLVG